MNGRNEGTKERRNEERKKDSVGNLKFEQNSIGKGSR